MQKTDRTTALATEPVGRLILKLSIPTVTAQLVNLLYNIVDRIYVGRIPGTGSLSLAGLGVTFPIILMISAVAMLFGMGGAPRAAIAMGKGDDELAERIMNVAALMLVIASVVLSGVFLITKDAILMRFGASESTLPFASEYITVYLYGTVFIQLTLGLNAFITNQGYTGTSMATTCIGAIINIVMDPVFIFVFGMGVKGAAYATVIAQAVSCLWVIKFLTGKKTRLRLRVSRMRPDMKILLSIVSLGISPFVMQSTECLIQLTFNNGMQTYGNDMYVALMSILFSLMQLIWMPMQGFQMGAQPIVSYNYGARNYDRVRQTFKRLFAICIVFSVTVIGLIEFMPDIFIGLFTPDENIISLGRMPVRIFLLGMSVMGAQGACQQTFLALGEAKISMFLALLRKVILLWPLALLLPHICGLGIWGLFLAEPISDFIAAATTTVMFTIRSRKLLKGGKVPDDGGRIHA